MFNKKGFTLIELLVVVLIIGILAAIALPQYTKTVEKSRASEAMLTLKSLSDAAQRVYLTDGNYDAITPDFSNLDIDVNTITQNFSYSTSPVAGCSGNICTLIAHRQNTGQPEKYYISYNLQDGKWAAISRTCTPVNDNTSCNAINNMFGVVGTPVTP